MLGNKLSDVCMLGKHSAQELHPQPEGILLHKSCILCISFLLLPEVFPQPLPLSTADMAPRGTAVE